MICTFCGTENREENRFCGMCGVRLERRKVDRRVRHGSNLKCESCGNVNEPGYKFCGMCGTRVERRMSERRGAATPAAARTEATGNVLLAAPQVAATARPAAEQAHTAARQRASDARPSAPFRSSAGESLRTDRVERVGIQGPSFLGLSDEPEDDATYLLEEESSSHSGLRKLVLLVILAAIVGLIFVQYRSSLHANPKPAEPSHPSSQQQNQPSPAMTSPQQESLAPPATAPAGAPGDPSPQPAAQDPAPSAPSQRNDSVPQVTPAKAERLLTEELEPANASETSLSDAPDATAKRADSAAVDSALNAPVPAEQKPSSTLIRAQQFLHGRGVPQNCEQGLVYLRAAAQKNEPAAAVQMGALYASGHCVHQDRVMAYRWFNSAHELQPANQWIQKNMDLLWGQMTEQERRLAGY
jgi:Double zinc ribbon